MLFGGCFIELWGRGFKKIQDAFNEVGLPMPQVSNFCGGTRVVIKRPNLDSRVNSVNNSELFNVSEEVTPHVTPHVSRLVKTISQQRLTLKQIMDLMRLKERRSFNKLYLKPALDMGNLTSSYPETPKRPNQLFSDRRRQNVPVLVVAIRDISIKGQAHA